MTVAGSSAVGKYLSHIDNTYHNLFMDAGWRDSFDKIDTQKLDSPDVCSRVMKYLNSAGGAVQIPIAEAMVMCRGKG